MHARGLNLPEARRRIDAIARFDLTWVEEPLPTEDLAGQASLRKQARIPIQTGENWWYPSGAMVALSAGACDHAMLDLIKIGGVTGWMASAALAAQHGMPVSSHLFQEASAHVLAATPMALWLEHLDVAGSLLLDPARIANGTLTAKGPGLGLVWNEDAIARLTC
jgi:mandelate racemase